MTGSKGHFDKLLRDLPGFGKYYSLKALNDPRIEGLPFSIRVLLESAIRNCDEFEVKSSDVENILNSQQTSGEDVIEIPFKPARVLLQDYSGLPALVDLAAMRDALARLGGNPSAVNPLVPVELVVDHSIQVEHSRSSDALARNEEIEFNRNRERFEFLKWGSTSFQNMVIVPPGSGIVHQVNLEYLARGVFNSKNLLYPDSLVGTDSHTTMINGLGVVGWGVGGIEAEAVMLEQPISMVLPQVVGFKLTGKLDKTVTATDLVLTVTQMLRQKGVVGKFVEFFGEGCRELAVADRATIANMSPEYGATMGFFPTDEQSIEYFRQTGRSQEDVKLIEEYLKAQGLFRLYDGSQPDPHFSGGTLSLDLSTVKACLSGPKRPQDNVSLSEASRDFQSCLTSKIGFKGFGISSELAKAEVPFSFNGQQYTLRHGSVVIAAITSCTNTSNPSVMIGAGLLAKKAVERELSVAPYIKTSLSPGSKVVLEYLRLSGLLEYLEKLGFFLAGLGCMTCIGNSGDLDKEVADAIREKDLVAAAVLSGNRNFEGRVHPLTRANYLASPPLCVAYALAGSLAIDLQTEPIGVDKQNQPVYLKEVWPSRDEIGKVMVETVLPQLFRKSYSDVAGGNKRWNELPASNSQLYPWNEKSTYIANPPFFQSVGLEPSPIESIVDSYCLLHLGDSFTTDHISPAGSISTTSPAGRYLIANGVEQKDFNSYGARRGNDKVLTRGTFANIRIVNKLSSKPGPYTIHIPSGDELAVFDAAEKYREAKHQLIVLAGKEYGTGSSRDWAAKGPYLLGVKAVIAQSYERIHRSNLVGMGVLPLQFLDRQTSESFGLTGRERFTIHLTKEIVEKPGIEVEVKVSNGLAFKVKSRLDTEVEVEYYRQGGILNFVLRKLVAQEKGN